MPHRTIGLPIADVDLSFSHGLLWSRSRIGVLLYAIDPETLQVHHTLKVDTATSYRSIQATGTHVAVDAKYAEVVAVSLSSGAIAWNERGKLCGTVSEDFVIATGEAVLRVSPTGAMTQLCVAKERSLSPLACGVDANFVWTIVDGELLGIRADGTRGGSKATRLERPGALLALSPEGPLVIELHDTKDGPTARVAAPNDGGWRSIATVAGEPFSAVASKGVLAMTLRDRAVVLAIPLAGGPPVEIAGGASPVACGDCIAMVLEGALAVVAPGPDGLVVSRVPLPTKGHESVAASDHSIYVAVAKQLFVIDRLELIAGDQSISFRSAAEPPKGDPQPARVVFAGASLVSVDHPRLRRLSLARTAASPPLVKGDEVLIDAFYEMVPGTYKVTAWHKKGDAAEAPAEAEPIRFDIASLPKIAAGTPPAVTPLFPVLTRVFKELSAGVSPRLEKLVTAHDKDPVFRRWLDRFSFLLEVTGQSITHAPGTDPCLLGLAGNGGGDVTSFYFYPPAHRHGAELPVVDFWHETHEIEWLASDFESFWSHLLDEQSDSEVARLIRERIGRRDDAPQAPPTPDWFLAAHGPGPEPKLSEVRELLKTDPLRAERQLVRLMRRDYDNDKLVEDLAAVYDQLGWSWHKKNLLANAG